MVNSVRNSWSHRGSGLEEREGGVAVARSTRILRGIYVFPACNEVDKQRLDIFLPFAILLDVLFSKSFDECEYICLFTVI